MQNIDYNTLLSRASYGVPIVDIWRKLNMV